MRKTDQVGRLLFSSLQLADLCPQVKTLAANVAVGQARRKKENPYLSHRGAAHQPKGEEGNDGAAGAGGATASVLTQDERLKTSSREGRAKRTFNFVEAGECLHV